MNFSDFFKNSKFVSYPKNDEVVIFSCDDKYFKTYGFYTLISLDKVSYNTHIHVINPTQESISQYNSIVKKLINQHSISTELIDFFETSEPEVKSYYFMSRFFLANHIFENYACKSLFITDADLIFNERIDIPTSVGLAFNYRPERETLWEKSAAYLVYVTEKRKSFIVELLNEYKTRHSITDFSKIPFLDKKIDRLNLAGLDQVCLTCVLEKQCDKTDFLNLRTIESLESKGEFSGKIWVLVGKGKKIMPENYLRNKFMEYF